MNNTLRTYTTVSQISLVTGIVALVATGGFVAGEILMRKSEPSPPKEPNEPKEPSESTAWAILPSAPGAQIGGVSVVGRF